MEILELYYFEDVSNCSIYPEQNSCDESMREEPDAHWWHWLTASE